MAISPKKIRPRPLPVWPLEGRKLQTSAPSSGHNSHPFSLVLET